MSTESRNLGYSPLVTSVALANFFYGGLFIAFGVYVLVAGADAVGKVMGATDELKKLAPVPKEQAKNVNQVMDIASKGVAGVFLAMAGIVAGCSIVQGLPLVGVGLGVLYRRRWARVLAMLFAILAGLQGLGCLLGANKAPPVLVMGGMLVAYCVLTFVGLLGRRAAAEFSGTFVPSESAQPTSPVGNTILVGVSTCVATVLIGWMVVHFASTSPDNTTKTKEKAAPDAKVDTLSPEQRLADFHAAVDKGNVSRALECVKLGTHVDDRDDKGLTALMRAAAKGQTGMAVMTIALGAQINERDPKGQTALMKSSAGGYGSIVNMLLGKVESLMEIQVFRSRHAALLKAPDLGNLADKLKDAKAPKDLPGFKDIPGFKDLPDIGKFTDLVAPLRLPPVEINAQDSEGRTALMYASLGGHVDVIKSLTLSNADRELVDKEGNMAWMLAAEAGHRQAMLVALTQLQDKLSLNRKNKAGKTAYELAATNGHADVVDWLRGNLGELVKEIKIVPKVEPVGRAGDSPLFKAVEAGDVNMVQELVNRGTPIDGRDEKGQTVLMLAASKGDGRIVLVLVNHAGKAHPELLDARDAEGRTAFVHAALSGQSEVMDALLIALSGAWNRGKLNWFRTLDRRDKAGKNALETAQAKGNKVAAGKIDDYYRAKMDVTGVFPVKEFANPSITALAHLAGEGDFATVQALLAREPNLKNGSANIQALHTAACAGHILVAKALIDAIPTAADRSWWLKYPITTSNGGSADARYLAQRNGHQELAAYLAQEQARAEKGETVVVKTDPKTALPLAVQKAIPDSLAKALADNDPIAVQTFFDGGGVCEGVDEEGRSPILLAAAKGQDKILLALIASVRTAKKKGVSTKGAGKTSGYKDIFAKDKDDRTALILAAAGGHDASVEYLLVALQTAWEQGSQNWFVYLEHPDKTGKTAREQAEAKGHTSVVKRLKAFHDEFLNHRSSTVQFNGTALEAACRDDDVELLKRLLKNNANPFRHKVSNFSGLQLAVQMKHVRVVQALLDSFEKDSLSKKNYIKSRHDVYPNALALAAEKGHLLLVQMLLEAFGNDNEARKAAIVMSGDGFEGGYRYETNAAVGIARSLNHREIVILLEKYLKE